MSAAIIELDLMFRFFAGRNSDIISIQCESFFAATLIKSSKTTFRSGKWIFRQTKLGIPRDLRKQGQKPKML
jgi:hypothetical protein